MTSKVIRIPDKLVLPLIILIALIFRLSLTNIAFHGDLVVQAGWGKWIYLNKSMFGFYENNVWIYGWPNQPPLISFLYGFGFKIHEWLNTYFVGIGNFIALNHLGAAHIPWFYKFTVWFNTQIYSDTPYVRGQLISLKLIPILGDLVLAWIIYLLAKNLANTKKAIFIVIIYLLSPFSWYESAIWGQHDQLSTIFLLLSLLLLTNKAKFLAPILFLISIGIKPTGVIFAPLFLLFSLKNKKIFLKIIAGSLIALFLYFLLGKLISPNNFLIFNSNLSKQMFAKNDWATWRNVYNFWRLFTGPQTDSRILFLGISYQIWGYILFGLINLYAYLTNRKLEFWSILKALFIISFGGWLFMTTMHERYLFTAVVTGLLLTVKYPKLFVWWLILSIVFWLNLYNDWFEPGSWVLVKNLLTWPNELLVAKLLSVIMITLFFIMTWIIKERSGEKIPSIRK